MIGNSKQFVNLWSLKDVQRHFNCGRNKALALMQSKTFPSFKIGRVYYVVENDVYEWVKKNKNHTILL